jgi:hypothetical protein
MIFIFLKKIIRKFKIKNVHVANESCCKYEKFQSKILYILGAPKKTNLAKFCDRLITAVRWKV